MAVLLILQGGPTVQLFAGFHTAYAAASANWEVVGTPGISVGTVTNKRSTVATSVYGDTPYVAYTDRGLNNKLVVRKYSESTWEYVGSSNGISAGIADCISLFLYSGTPYVAYYDETLRQVIAKRYNGSTLTWDTLGSLGYVDNSVSSYNIALEVYEGTPYVAYQDSDYKATVRSLNGDDWDVVGQAGFSADRALTVSMSVYGGDPYVVYQDYKSDKATVMKFDGSAWNPLGQAGFSDGSALNTKIKVYNGIPYVAYLDQANGGRATVKRFDGNVWENVGQAGFSQGGVTYLSLDINNGVPYVAYDDGGNNKKATVKMFDGNAWADVGQTAISQSQSSYLSLSAGGGMLYAAYRDMWNDYKATIMAYPIHGIDGFADQTLAELEFGYDSGSRETKTITVKRAGAGDLNNLSVRISGGSSDSFALTQPIDRTLNDSLPTTTFTIRANEGLAVGTYEATVAVEADNMAPRYFKISQTVMPRQADAPTAVPAGGGILFGETVALTTATPGATIRYTTDGSAPTASSAAYTGPIPITAHTTIKAIALKAGTRDSEVMTEFYTAAAASPAASPTGGEVLSGTTVTLTTETPGASIAYCTRTGSDPTLECAAYTGPIRITDETTIQATARKDGIEESAMMSERYTIRPQAAAPVAVPSGGVIVPGTFVVLSTAAPGATIYYTTDGSYPTASSAIYAEPIPITAETTIKAIAAAPGIADSEVMSERYTLMTPAAAPFNLTARAVDRSVALSWDDSAAAGSVTYSVYRYAGLTAPADPGLWELVQSNIEDRAYTVTGLTNGTSYSFAVTAFNAGGTSEFSDSTAATPAASSSGSGGSPSGGGWIPAEPALSEAAADFGGIFRIMAGNYSADRMPELSVNQAEAPAAEPGLWRITAGYEVVDSSKLLDNVNSTAAVYLRLNADSRLPEGYEPRLFLFDKRKREWIDLGGERQNGYLKARSDRLGIFAGFLVRDKETATDAGFVDIDRHWAAPWIELGSALGLTGGYPDRSFRPQKLVNRLEFTSMLLRLTSRELSDAEGRRVGAEQRFSDWSDMPDWGAEYALAALEAGIVQGYPDGTFRPHATLTRAEMIAMMQRTMRLPEADPALLEDYRDKDEVPEWAVSAMAALLEAKYVQGSGAGNLEPLTPATRAEVIKILTEAYLETLRR
ncbi:chitobiase/beta-hexosaminidase C-terminal domain-containing protein [Cohnella cellulosilytica]